MTTKSKSIKVTKQSINLDIKYTPILIRELEPLSVRNYKVQTHIPKLLSELLFPHANEEIFPQVFPIFLQMISFTVAHLLLQHPQHLKP